MKKTTLLNSHLSQVIASMGHTDMLVISDAGFPVPPGVQRIDLAVTAGLPSLLDVVRAVAAELEVERVTIATELQARATSLPADLQACFPHAEPGCDQPHRVQGPLRSRPRRRAHRRLHPLRQRYPDQRRDLLTPRRQIRDCPRLMPLSPPAFEVRFLAPWPPPIACGR